jgi:hypothetical protein
VGGILLFVGKANIDPPTHKFKLYIIEEEKIKIIEASLKECYMIYIYASNPLGSYSFKAAFSLSPVEV